MLRSGTRMHGKICNGMRNLLIGVALLLMLPGSQVHATELNQDDARRLLEAGEIRPLSVILEAAQTAHSGRVLEVELKREHNQVLYEVEMIDPQGRIWELRIDAATAKVLDTRRED